jgi:hypothetical protein
MPAPKDYIKIQYPRKCNQCDYVSNNPQMWHYHNKTHFPIPTDQLCDHGCKNPALFLGTGGKYTCLKIAHQCPEYIKKHSVRIKNQWENDNDRKEKTKELFIKRVQTSEVVEKMKATKRKKSGLLTPEDAKNYRHYARAIRERAQMWAKSQGYVLGQQTYHVDHKFSILDSWHANLPAAVVNHPANLQILEAKENSSKGSKSCITLAELFKLISRIN